MKIFHQLPLRSAQFQICLLASPNLLLLTPQSHTGTFKDGGHEVAKGWHPSAASITVIHAVQSDTVGFNSVIYLNFD